MSKAWKAVSAGALALSLVALVAAVILGSQPQDSSDPWGVRSSGYDMCDVYVEQGCTKQVVASGGETEIQSGGTLDVQAGATFNIGSNYPVVLDTASSVIVVGGGSITGTASYAHGLTTVEFAACHMNQTADDDAGDAARCVATHGTTTITATLYQDDWVTQATETDIPITYVAIGQ